MCGTDRKRHGVVEIADLGGLITLGKRQVKSRNRMNSANATEG